MPEPERKAEIKINVKKESIINYKPRRLAFTETVALQKIINDLLADNIIRPSNSEYSSPIVLVKKKNGDRRLSTIGP